MCPLELFKMVCEDDEPDVEIGIPAVMLPDKIGEILENVLTNNSEGMLLFLCSHLHLTVCI